MRTVGLYFVRKKSERRELQLMLLGRTWTCVGRLFLSAAESMNCLVSVADPPPGGRFLVLIVIPLAMAYSLSLLPGQLPRS